MRSRFVPLLRLLVLAAALWAGCAAPRTARGWQPGERIICPRCAQEFTVPEKLGD